MGMKVALCRLEQLKGQAKKKMGVGEKTGQICMDCEVAPGILLYYYEECDCTP